MAHYDPVKTYLRSQIEKIEKEKQKIIEKYITPFDRRIVDLKNHIEFLEILEKREQKQNQKMEENK
jgi:hypothetical protein